jgi:eukaryotic-like serine/threonine-protein kinase
MTPDRWLQINTLFEVAVELHPIDRQGWLRHACGDDNELCREVQALLEQDTSAGTEGFLTPPDLPPPSLDTSSWPGRDQLPQAPRREPADRRDARAIHSDSQFAPHAAIYPGPDASRPSETEVLVRERLRGLPVIYSLLVALRIIFAVIVSGFTSQTILSVDAAALLVLGAITALLWGQRRLSLAGLRYIELVMIALLAGLFCFTQYYNMMNLSARGEPMAAWSSLKNNTLFTAILILTFGLYVPKDWRRAAVVGGVLAVLPCATLVALDLFHPSEMAWLTRGWIGRGITPLKLSTFDASLLAILAAGTAYGAHVISRLRRQVVEARQLGQYHLKRKLGSGGMGEVYLAEHGLLKRPCAVKLLRPGGSARAFALELFEREVRLTANLSHWNTVEIFDYGRTEDGTYYYVMEYLPGLSLAELVTRYGPLPPGRVVYLLRQVCRALAEAHGSGLIHRDVKPSNIFAARRGGMDDIAKLLDFGLVQPAPATAPASPSWDGRILGTPLFMSPEQAKGSRELGERSDIYSLGGVAYYLLTAKPPFDVNSGIRAMMAHAHDRVAPPSLLRPDIPADLERVVLRCLAKDPADRFENAKSIERALVECACAHDWDQDRAAAWWRQVETSEDGHAASGQ